MPRTIKCNPSWEASARILLMVITSSDSETARLDAQEELLRGMRGYDAMLRKHTDYFSDD